MSETTELIIRDESVRLGALQLTSPQDVIQRATMIAQELAKIVDSHKLYSVIGGKKFVRVEGWATMGAMLGILPREFSCIEHESGDFEAVVELIRASDGAVIGQGSAIVGMDEQTWSKRPRYARLSMALTRATGKAFRLGFSWIIALAGYEVTPAEEMDGVIIDNAPPPPPEYRLSLETAMSVTSSDGQKYGDLSTEKLSHMANTIAKKLKAGGYTPDKLDEMRFKLDAIRVILSSGRPEPSNGDAPPPPETNGL